MTVFDNTGLLILISLIYLPWSIMAIWWYSALVYSLVFHRVCHTLTSNFTIKVLTKGDEVATLSDTVSFCRKEPLVVSRKYVSLPRGAIKVLPATFRCNAQYKGEQLEWARKSFPSSRTLYLDEDSLCDFDHIPVGDIVQFTEVPVGNNRFIQAIEAHRVGFQMEQAIFEKTGPLYLWGGGIAISQDLENQTTWDRATITEDTAFLYAARRPYVFWYSKQPIYDQAPPTVKAVINQRWRWASGTYHDMQYMQWGWRKLFIYYRTVLWGLWPFSVLALIVALPILSAPFWLTFPLLGQAMVWSFAGTRTMKMNWKDSLFTVLATPIASVVHSLGSTKALVVRTKVFNPTPKVRMLTNHHTPELGLSTNRRMAVASTAARSAQEETRTQDTAA